VCVCCYWACYNILPELSIRIFLSFFFFFQAEDGIRDRNVTGVQTCALPISPDRILPSWEESGQEALIRGLGMGFFDAMSMLTVGRGGAFIPDATAPAGLRYQPSGREPRILAMAGRGYPQDRKSVV